MELQDQRTERRNPTSARFVKGVSRLADIYNVIREYTQELRLSCVPSLDVKLGQVGRIIYSNSMCNSLRDFPGKTMLIISAIGLISPPLFVEDQDPQHVQLSTRPWSLPV
jgi:hypothetical protein